MKNLMVSNNLRVLWKHFLAGEGFQSCPEFGENRLSDWLACQGQLVLSTKSGRGGQRLLLLETLTLDSLNSDLQQTLATINGGL